MNYPLAGMSQDNILALNYTLVSNIFVRYHWLILWYVFLRGSSVMVSLPHSWFVILIFM